MEYLSLTRDEFKEILPKNNLILRCNNIPLTLLKMPTRQLIIQKSLHWYYFAKKQSLLQNIHITFAFLDSYLRVNFSLFQLLHLIQRFT